MAQSSAPKPSLTPPNITPVSRPTPQTIPAQIEPANHPQTDLAAFHKAHFSTPSLDHFSTHFLGPAPEDENQEEEEDDGLGYYPDGVKRTLTDEQIAMFRHSEIQALLRERRHAEENKATHARDDEQAGEVEEGELEDDQEAPAPEPEQPRPAANLGPQNGGSGNTKRQKGEQRKGRGHKQPPKPDLRKRTWDKVDRGLQSLDYGEEEDATAAMPAAPQRRRISYEDV
jgi:hypothetical protein